MWLKNRTFSVLDWAANSPDLNIIESVWRMMETAILKDKNENATEMTVAVKDAWLELYNQIIRNLHQ